MAGAIAVLLIGAGVFGWRLERQVRTSAEQLNETQRQLRLTTETAARQINETQVQASRAISAAQELTARTQMISDVLAAPDLIRFPLVGRDSLEAAQRAGAVEPFARNSGVQRVGTAGATPGFDLSGLAPDQDRRRQCGDLCSGFRGARDRNSQPEGPTAGRRHGNNGA